MPKPTRRQFVTTAAVAAASVALAACGATPTPTPIPTPTPTHIPQLPPGPPSTLWAFYNEAPEEWYPQIAPLVEGWNGIMMTQPPTGRTGIQIWYNPKVWSPKMLECQFERVTATPTTGVWLKICSK